MTKMPLNGAQAKAVYALSGCMGLVAQWFRQDFLHGTVAAISFFVWRFVLHVGAARDALIQSISV
jgi:hypothetical protein